LAGNGQIASEVAKNPNSVGHVATSFAKAPGVKELSIEGRSASPTSFKGSHYAYGRQCCYCTNGKISDKTKS
jgi:ABC-type phosphate transport system substrate-binding protein